MACRLFGGSHLLLCLSRYAVCVGLALPFAAGAAERQMLKPGHVPAAVRRLAAVGTLPGTQRLNLAIGLPLRNQPELDDPALAALRPGRSQ